LGLAEGGAEEERGAGAFDAGIADFAAGNGQKEALEKEVYTLEVLANFKRTE
jgi:hypothetical protein